MNETNSTHSLNSEKDSNNKANKAPQPTAGWDELSQFPDFNEYTENLNSETVQITQENLAELFNNFIKESYQYGSSEELFNDMDYFYSFLKEIKTANSTNLKPLYKKLTSSIGLIRFKHGFESNIIDMNPELQDLKKQIDDTSLTDQNIIDEYAQISTEYTNFTKQVKNLDFIQNNYENLWGKESAFLALESLKSLITNDEYRKLLDKNQISDILTDCIKLNNDEQRYLKKLEKKYKGIIQQIWQNSLSNTIDENQHFRMLFSNISGNDLKSHAILLLNRPEQSSANVISSEFVALYGSTTSKIGFIYPNDSEILMMSAYDLGSNVFGMGIRNTEKGSLLATPKIIERIGIKRAQDKGEDLYSSTCYNEILINAKPCGIAILGLGEGEINTNYQNAKALAEDMNLPITEIDLMQYKNELSENDKIYLAYHAISSSLESSKLDLTEPDNSMKIYKITDKYKDSIAKIFLELKTNGELNKANLSQAIKNLIPSL